MNKNRLAVAIAASLAMSNTVWAVSCPSPIDNLISIPSGTTVSATGDACQILAGESIEVAVGGAITVNLAAGSAASAIIVPDGVAAGGIDMAGTLTVGAMNNLQGIRVGIGASLLGPIEVSGAITVESAAQSSPISVTGSVPAGIQVSGTLSAFSPPPSTSGSPVGIQLSGDGAWTPITVEPAGVVSGQFFGIRIFGAGTPGTPSTLTNHGEIREPTGAAFGGGIELIQSHRLATLTNHNLIQARGVRGAFINHALVVNDFLFRSGSEIDVFTNTGTVTAIDGGNAVYVAQDNSRINTLDNEIGATISAVNMGSGVVTEGLIGTLTNRGTISGAVSGIGVQDFDDYYYGLKYTGRIDTLINLGTITGGVFDIDAPERDLEEAAAPIGTLINAQTDLTYRGTLPENYRVVITSTTQYGSLDAVPGPSLMSFDISADDSVITPNFLYTGVMKGIGAGLLAQTTGVTEGIAWTLLGNPDNSWDLCTGPVTDGQCQTRAPQAPLVAVADPGTIEFGGTSALTTTGGSGDGAVSFAVTTGSEFCSVSEATLTGTGVGSCTVTATKAADDNFDVATGAVEVNVVKAAQDPLVAVADPGSIAFGGTSALTTTGGSGDGSVSFAVTAGSEFCSVTGATLTGTGVGSCTVTATKAADDNFNVATAAVEVSVVKADQDPLFAVADPGSIAFGGTSALTTTGGSGDGSVSFAVTAGSEFCSVTGATLTGTGVGSCTVTATKAADDNFNVATGAVEVSVVKADQVPLVAVADPGTIEFGGTSALTTTGGSGDGSVSFAVTAGSEFCSVTGATLTGTGVGSCTVTATKAADDNFNAATGTVEVNVVKAAQAPLVALANPRSVVIGGTSSLSTTGGSGDGAVSFAVTTGSEFCSVTGATLTGTGVGSCTVTATKAADDNFNAATAAVEVSVVEIEPVPVPIGKPGWFLLLVGLLGALGIRNLSWQRGRH